MEFKLYLKKLGFTLFLLLLFSVSYCAFPNLTIMQLPEVMQENSLFSALFNSINYSLFGIILVKESMRLWDIFFFAQLPTLISLTIHHINGSPVFSRDIASFWLVYLILLPAMSVCFGYSYFKTQNAEYHIGWR